MYRLNRLAMGFISSFVPNPARITHQLLIVSMAIYLCAILWMLRTYVWVSSAEIVEGKVVELMPRKTDRGTAYIPKISYEINHSSLEFTPFFSMNRRNFQVGETVKVVVNPSLKQRSLASFRALYGLPILITITIATLDYLFVILFNGNQILHILHPYL